MRFAGCARVGRGWQQAMADARGRCTRRSPVSCHCPTGGSTCVVSGGKIGVFIGVCFWKGLFVLSRARKLLALGAVVALTVPLTGSVSVAERSTSDGDWATWQKDLFGSRYAAAEHRINARNVKDLKLKWAFAYPKTANSIARSEPGCRR
ncbi:hypothetical protein [Kibdelosporangium aridum]|uniref:hypothetical protein n=1 Tax=Kibdelosporangium aridum TaxID=2030 RepID=UPI0035ECAE57